jgi:hypothetical protein
MGGMVHSARPGLALILLTERRRMTKREWLSKAEEYDRKIEELMEAGEDGSYLEYLHQKAQWCRSLAAEAEE